jgi:hypothetical protein
VWSSHTASQHDRQRAALLTAYNRVTAAVAAARFPAGIERYAPSKCVTGEQACGHSPSTPPQLLPRLLQMVGTGAHQMFPAGGAACSGLARCPVSVTGRLGGMDVFATATWHLIAVPHGKPARGSVSAPHGHGRLFFVGSDVSVGVDLPLALRS